MLLMQRWRTRRGLAQQHVFVLHSSHLFIPELLFEFGDELLYDDVTIVLDALKARHMLVLLQDFSGFAIVPGNTVFAVSRILYLV